MTGELRAATSSTATRILGKWLSSNAIKIIGMFVSNRANGPCLRAPPEYPSA